MDSYKRIERNGQLGKNREEWTVMKEQREMDSQEKIERNGQLEKKKEEKTGSRGQAEDDLFVGKEDLFIATVFTFVIAL